MAHHLEFEHWLPLPPEEVFPFFADPRNLRRISPPGNDVRVLGAKLVSRDSAEPDLKFVISFRPFPSLPFIRLRWTVLITDFEFGTRFRDVQLAGPFKSWEHVHEFPAAARDGVTGTLIRDVLTYEVRYGIFGALVDALFICRNLKKMFVYRQCAVQELLLNPDESAG